MQIEKSAYNKALVGYSGGHHWATGNLITGSLKLELTNFETKFHNKSYSGQIESEYFCDVEAAAALMNADNVLSCRQTHTADITIAPRLNPCVYQRTPERHRPLETVSPHCSSLNE